MTTGKLILIPSLLAENEPEYSLPPRVLKAANEVDVFLVERAKTARRFLRKIGFAKDFDTLEMLELNKRTTLEEKIEFVQSALTGKVLGIISEAGCPGVADPGADVVALAHDFGVEVEPLVGPSSILLALMASGLNGQSFAFNGYLPIDSRERIKKMRDLEKVSKQLSQTQLFIETPYRNVAMWKDMMNALRPDTKVSVAAGLTENNAYIKTKTVKNWKSSKPAFDKRPAVFGILMH